MKPIDKAVIFAAKKHSGQLRKGTEVPYIVHPVEVMKILIENKCTEKVIIAGILHDTIEDAKIKPKEIRNKFGEEVMRIVQSESEDKKKTWEERKQATIDHLKTASLEVKLVCCADKLSNIRAMKNDEAAIGEKLWERFKAPKDRICWYYRGVFSALTELDNYPMYKELNVLINEVFG
jgi:(p)ppGpp synthase/HD superfamily hydrolase